MHTLTRRAALGGIALLPATATAEPASPSPLAALIADWRPLHEEANRLFDLIDDWRETGPKLRPERVVYGRLIGAGDGPKPLYARSHAEIDRECDRLAVPFLDAPARAERLRARLHAELSDIEQANARTRAATNIDQLEAALRASNDAEDEAFRRVLEYRPRTLDDFMLREAFLAERVEAGCDLAPVEQALVFGGEDLARRLDA